MKKDDPAKDAEVDPFADDPLPAKDAAPAAKDAPAPAADLDPFAPN